MRLDVDASWSFRGCGGMAHRGVEPCHRSVTATLITDGSHVRRSGFGARSRTVPAANRCQVSPGHAISVMSRTSPERCHTCVRHDLSPISPEAQSFLAEQ